MLGRGAGLRLPFMACDVELSSFILSPRDDLYEGTELSREYVEAARRIQARLRVLARARRGHSPAA